MRSPFENQENFRISTCGRTVARSVFCAFVLCLLALTACQAPPPAATPAAPLATAPAATATRPASPTATTALPTAAATNAGTCPEVQTGQADPAAVLEMGPGPGIPPSSAAGDKLVLIGAVYDADCAALAGATLNLWQTDANGEYGPGHGSNDMRCCYLMGSLQTDRNGRFQIITVMPAHYAGEQAPPPAHIHVEIRHPETGAAETEIVFAGDPYLPASLRGYALVRLEEAPPAGGEPAYLFGTAEIILR